MIFEMIICSMYRYSGCCAMGPVGGSAQSWSKGALGDLLRIRSVHSVPSPFQLSCRVREVAFRSAEAPEPSGEEKESLK